MVYMDSEFFSLYKKIYSIFFKFSYKSDCENNHFFLSRPSHQVVYYLLKLQLYTYMVLVLTQFLSCCSSIFVFNCPCNFRPISSANCSTIVLVAAYSSLLTTAHTRDTDLYDASTYFCCVFFRIPDSR